MKKVTTLRLSLTVIFTSLLVTGTLNAFAQDPQLDIVDATIFENPSEVSAKINAAAALTLTGAKGTGVITDGTLAVTTTHGVGVLDSELQADGFDPIQHNHYVNLIAPVEIDDQTDDTDCADQVAFAEVDSLSFESPGIAMWPGNMYKMWEVPKASPPGEYHDAITGDQMDFTLGSLTNTGFGDHVVVSFSLSLGGLGQVCVFVHEVQEASLEDLVKVGGLPIAIDSNALLLAGIQSSAIWMLPILAGAAGAGAYFVRTRMNKE